MYVPRQCLKPQRKCQHNHRASRSRVLAAEEEI